MRIARLTVVPLLLCGLARAQAPAAADPAPAAGAKPPPWYERATVSGYVDAYYQIRDAAQSAPDLARVFDVTNGLNLGYAKLTAAVAPAPAGLRIDLGFGQAADVVSPPGSAGAASPLKYVQQAYAALKLGPVELDAGRFVTSAGAEVIEAKDDWLYSRSLLFSLIPFTHVGARAVTALSKDLTLTLGVNDGWDVPAGGQSVKTGQVSLAFAGPSSTTAAVNVYSGINPTLFTGAANTASSWRTLVDVVVGGGAGPLELNLNFDWSTEAGRAWYGLAAMARWHLPGDVARLSARGEWVKDRDGVRFGTGVDTRVYEGTISLAVPVGGSAEVRVEARGDHASEPIFVKRIATAPDPRPVSTQWTGTIAALAWF
jgi:hypothetical protein